MTRGDRVIAISEFIADHIRTQYRTDPDRIRVIHRGVDDRIYDPAAVPAPRIIRLAEEWRLPDGVPVILMPGRLTRWKGQRVFLEALRQLDREDFVAVVVGSAQGRDSYAAELRKLTEQHSLQGVLRFAPHCNDMPAAFHARRYRRLGLDRPGSLRARGGRSAGDGPPGDRLRPPAAPGKRWSRAKPAG